MFLHSKGNHKQNEKTTHRMEKIFVNDVSNKGLISKVYKQVMQLYVKTNKQTTQSKNGQTV